MENLFEIFVNIIEEFIILLFLSAYFGCKYDGKKKYAAFAAGMAISVGTITLLDNVSAFGVENFLGLFLILIYFSYSCIFLKGDVYTKIFISCFTDCVVVSIADLSSVIVSFLFNKNIPQLSILSAERIILIVMTKLLLICVCVFLYRHKISNVVKEKNIIVLIIMPILTEILFAGITPIYLKYGDLKEEMVALEASIVVLIMLMYYMFVQINHDAKLKTDYAVLSQKYESDKAHAGELKELYEKTCGIKHDLNIYFYTAMTYLENDVEKAKEYMNSVMNEKIKDDIRYIETDNEYFDAIVNTKLAVCHKKGILAQVRVMNNTLSKLSDEEIGIIFGNLLDNAIKAADESKEKTIELDVKKQSVYVSIIAQNSIDGSVLDANGDLNTTKSDKQSHGFGVKNIRRIVRDHDGIIDYFEEDNRFFCHILV